MHMLSTHNFRLFSQKIISFDNNKLIQMKKIKVNLCNNAESILMWQMLIAGTGFISNYC